MKETVFVLIVASIFAVGLPFTYEMSLLFVYLFHYGVSHVNVIKITHQIMTEFPISMGVTRMFCLGESEIMQFLFLITG